MENNQQPLAPQQQRDQLYSVPPTTPHSSSKAFIILIVVIITVAVSVGGYILGTKQNQIAQNQPQPAAPTSQPSPISTSTPSVFPTTEPSITADWKTYRNEKYGFEVRYPEEWAVEILPSENQQLSLRFYDIQTDRQQKEFVEECRSENPPTKCGTESFATGIFISTQQNLKALNFEQLFRQEIAQTLTIYPDPEEIIAKAAEKNIGSLRTIYGNKVDITGWPYYYFLSPTKDNAFIAAGGNAAQIEQILSTFQFSN